MATGRPARLRRGLGAEYADWEARIRDFSNAEFPVGYKKGRPLGEARLRDPADFPRGFVKARRTSEDVYRGRQLRSCAIQDARSESEARYIVRDPVNDHMSVYYSLIVKWCPVAPVRFSCLPAFNFHPGNSLCRSSATTSWASRNRSSSLEHGCSCCGSICGIAGGHTAVLPARYQPG